MYKGMVFAGLKGVRFELHKCVGLGFWVSHTMVTQGPQANTVTASLCLTPELR